MRGETGGSTAQAKGADASLAHEAQPARKGERGKGRGGKQRGGKSKGVVNTNDVDAILALLQSEMRHSGHASDIMELGRIRGKVVPLCQDQYGSRFIQKKLDHATDEDKQMVFAEVCCITHAPGHVGCLIHMSVV